MTTVDKAVMRMVLAEHETIHITSNVGPHGWWVSVAQCRCGHTSPPEHRADHLTDKLVKALDVWLLTDT